jgi:hypothetical protein
MSAPTPTAGRPGRIITIRDHERFHEWTRDGKAVDPDADLEDGPADIDGLLTEIRQAEPSVDGIKPSRIAQ